MRFCAFLLLFLATPVRAELRVVTYNVNVALADDPATIERVKTLDADVVFLQEIDTRWAKRLRRQTRFPHVLIRTYRDRWGGLAVLSKRPVKNCGVLPAVDGPFPAGCTLIQTERGAIRFLNLHLFPPIRWFRKKSVLAAYAESQDVHLREVRGFVGQLRGETPTVLVGDLNEDRNGKAVTWLNKSGYRSAVASPAATWRWPPDKARFRWELDHILVDERIRVRDATVLSGGRSDHFPVRATVSIRPSTEK